VTSKTRPETEHLVASAGGAEEAASNPKRGKGGCNPARRLRLSICTCGNGWNNTATDLEKAVNFAQRARDNGMKDFPDPTSDGPLIDTSRIPSPYSSALELQGK
jgi:hypothetical protein